MDEVISGWSWETSRIYCAGVAIVWGMTAETRVAMTSLRLQKGVIFSQNPVEPYMEMFVEVHAFVWYTL